MRRNDSLRDLWPRDRIGSSAEFDDLRWTQFERNSRLPHGTFESPFTLRGRWLWVATAAVALMLALWVTSADVPDEAIRPDPPVGTR